MQTQEADSLSSPRAGASGQSQPQQVQGEAVRVSICCQNGSTVVAPILTSCSTSVMQTICTSAVSSEHNSKDVSHKEMQDKLKLILQKKYALVYEGIVKRGKPSQLVNIYTELYITEGESEQVNTEHEVWHVEAAAIKGEVNERPIECNDIFRQQDHIRCVLTKGIAGIGKTISIQKFVLDWADGSANSEITFVFPLPFRDLNLIKCKRFSLMGLIQHFFPKMKCNNLDDLQVLFIFDGLDECRMTLDFDKESCSDENSSASVDILITNLIKGNLLPSALVWITSRPAAVGQIPPDCVHLVTEIRGFSDKQKGEYFTKRFTDENLAKKVFDHVRSSKSLFIMCHIPIFCWISDTVLRNMLRSEDSHKTPTTLTEMYTHYLLLLQTKINNQKCGKEEEREIILKLGQLAFEQLKQSNVIFYISDLEKCGIQEESASFYSGIFTEFFKEEYGLYPEKFYCFVHLSIQEYLAALFVHFNYTETGKNVLNNTTSAVIELPELHRIAVTQALESTNGHLDLFLRFLLGISMDSSQKLLLNPLGRNSYSNESREKTIKQIRQEIAKNPSPNRAINLFHCLNELKDNSLVEEIQSYHQQGIPSSVALQPEQCSALAYVLLMSTDVLENFDLTEYNASAAGRRRLLPVLKISRRACLNHLNLTNFLMKPVGQVLESPNSILTRLDLGYNELRDKGVKQLCNSLKANRILKELCLGDCNLTGSCCEDLASLLKSPFSKLRDLELCGNDLQDAGVVHLCEALKEPHCQLQRLGLLGCRITAEGCDSLASALSSNPSHLRELDLSYNHPGESGVRLLSALLGDPSCKLEELEMDHCGPHRDKPGVIKYACQLSLDPNTVNPLLRLSENNRKVTRKGKESYPESPERFDEQTQVLCGEGLSGRCYWEVEWEGGAVDIAVAYKRMDRKGRGENSLLGFNDVSWDLHFLGDVYVFFHNQKSTKIQAMSAGSRKVGVYLDWPAGILDFYRIAQRTVQLHRIVTKFTEPLYPAFSVSQDYSLSICTLY